MQIYLLLLLVSPVLGVDPIITQEMVTDKHNNTADANSAIEWGALPVGKEYQTDTSYDVGAIAIFYDMARGFLNVVQPKDLPYDLIGPLMSGTIDIGGSYMELVMYALGFGICFVIGILFMIIMPILGCCFCCCRLCGNCGGARKQKLTKNSNCKCMCFTVTLIISTVIIIAGVACSMQNGQQIVKMLKNFGTVTETNLNDINYFINNTIGELKHAGVENYAFTVDVVERDLDSIGALLGVPIRDELDKQVDIEVALHAVSDFESQINTVGTDVHNVNDSIASLKTNGAALESGIDDVVVDIDAAKADGGNCVGCGAIDTSDLKMDVDFNNLPDISDEMQSLEDAQSKNLTALVEDGRQEFNDIPWKVHNETLSTVSTLKGQLATFKTTIGDQIAAIEEMPKMLTGTLDDAKNTISGFTGLIDPYYDYIGYAGLGLPGIFLLVGVLQTMGLLFGIIGYQRSAKPTERACMSNSGGNLLIAATAFTFIFSWLFMLVTCLFFMIGGNLEVLLCRTLVDPEYRVFKEMIDKPGFMDQPGYFLGNELLQDGSINLTVSGVLEGCKQNGAAFEVLMLDHYDGFSLDVVTDYKDKIDINTTIDAIDIPLNDVELMSPDMEKQLRDFSDSVQLNFTGFRDELQNPTVAFNFTEKVEVLRAAATASTAGSTAEIKLNSAAVKLEAMETGSYKTVNDAQAQLLDDIDALENSTAGIPLSVNTTIDTLNATEYELQTKGSPIVRVEAKKYGDRIMGVADSFADHTLKLVKEDMGKCRPVWNLWESLIHIALCRYTIDSFNGLWFGMGWCLFFMTVSIIFNVKLAKYFRKMNVLDAMDKPQLYQVDETKQRVASSKSGDKNLKKLKSIGNNKVIPT